MLPIDNPQVCELYESAKEVRGRAYAPFSKFRVGASIWDSSNQTAYQGCNIENVSYGGTMCAERVAIYSAISAVQKPTFTFMVIVADSDSGVIYPCGMCLQVIQEFCGADFPVYLGNTQALIEVKALGELLPCAFSDF